MFRLALVLFGSDALIQRWRLFFVVGLLAFGAGWVLLVDLIDGVADIAVGVLGGLLLLQGLFELLLGAVQTGLRRRLQLLRATAMLLGAGLVLDFPWDNTMAAGVLFGSTFLFNGLVRIGGAWLIRFPGWRQSSFLGLAYLVLAGLMLTSWPLPDAMNVSFCVGLALAAAGGVLMRGALRLKRLPPGTRLASLVLYSTPPPAAPRQPSTQADMGRRQPLVVHVWTAVDAAPDRIRLPVIERYIVAVTRQGRATSGHAALSCGPGLYISHHPNERLRIDAQNVLQQARAVEKNNRPGRWGSAYSQEEQASQPSSVKLRFHTYNAGQLDTFWRSYREDATYNFTHRNCSTVVVLALDAALEGVFAGRPFWRTMLRLVVHPDMWLAGSVRVRAESLAWSPGFVLDYARALRRITTPQSARGARRLRRLRWWQTRRSRRPVNAPL
ncbi:MAG: hypothetical protein H7Z77_01515 [Chitinophagaceae bacterium]|nr:hypothetical protein [Polaromonas sp.]